MSGTGSLADCEALADKVLPKLEARLTPDDLTPARPVVLTGVMKIITWEWLASSLFQRAGASSG